MACGEWFKNKWKNISNGCVTKLGIANLVNLGVTTMAITMMLVNPQGEKNEQEVAFDHMLLSLEGLSALCSVLVGVGIPNAAIPGSIMSGVTGVGSIVRTVGLHLKSHLSPLDIVTTAVAGSAAVTSFVTSIFAPGCCGDGSTEPESVLESANDPEAAQPLLEGSGGTNSDDVDSPRLQ